MSTQKQYQSEDKMRDAFNMFDTSKDNRITKDELKTVMQTLGLNPTDADVDEMIKEVDTDSENIIRVSNSLDPEEAPIICLHIGSYDFDLGAERVYWRFHRQRLSWASAQLYRLLAGLLSAICLVDRRVACFNVQNSGAVEFEEFKKMMEMHKGDPEEELKEAFKVFDKNGDGFISRDELVKTMEQLGVDGMSVTEIQDMMKDADKNGDGKIDYNEFAKVMQNPCF